MRLSWNEIRAREGRFAADWARAAYEKGETQSFYNDFFDVFGVQRRKVASFEEPVKKLGAKQGGATLADLYDPDTMPGNLRKAHLTLDRAVDKLYRTTPFASDRERVEHLFGLYEKLSTLLLSSAARAKRARKPAVV